MSVFCPKCGKKTFNEYNCDHCGYKIQEKKYIKEEKETITVNKTTIIITAIVIIAISISYLAIQKYLEQREIERAKQEIKETFKQAHKILDKSLGNLDKQNNKLINSISNIKPPVIDFGKHEREKAQKKKLEEIKKQIILQNSKREKEIYKQKLLLQMQK